MQHPVLTRRGRPRKDRRPHYLIAATVDYRGPDDDQLTFVFRVSLVTERYVIHI